MMTRRLALVLLGGLAACRGANQSVAPDGRDFPHVADTLDRHAPSMDVLSSFTYAGIDGRTVTLRGGVWRGSGADSPTISLVKGFRVTGDITQNGRDEAVVLLESRRANAPARTYLAVVGWIGGQLVSIATTPISDDVELRGGHVEPHRIVLDGVRRQPDGATPSPVRLTYGLERSTLRLIG